MSLGSKATGVLAAIVSTVLIIASFFLLHYQGESLKHMILEGLDGQAKLAAQGIESFINRGLRDSNVISTTMPVESLRRGRLDVVESHLKLMFETLPEFQDGIFILDTKGKFLVDYPPHPELRGRNFAFREYFQRTLQEGKGVVSNPYRSTRSGLPVLTFSAPVRDASGQVIAVLGCQSDLLSHDALGGYSKQKFGKTGYLYAFDRSRLLVLHPDDKRLLTDVEAGKNKILEAALVGFQGGGETVNSVGVPMLLSVQQIPNMEWIVAVQVTQEEAYAPVAEARRILIGISAAAIMLTLALGAITIRHITKPLQQLEGVASQISSELEGTEMKGAYDLDSSVLDGLRLIRSDDEIGRLAASFSRLATKLHVAFGSLQRSAEDWHRTFHAVNEALVTLDTHGRIVRMNKTAEDWFGTSIKESQGQCGFGVICGTTTPPERWPDIASLKEHQQVRWSQGLEKPRGFFEFTVTPLLSSDGSTGAVLIVDDITQRVESEGHSREIARAFQIASRTLTLLVNGLNEETYSEVAKIIYEETGVGAVAITDTETVRAFIGFGADHHIPGDSISSALTRLAIHENRVVFADGMREHYRCDVSDDCPLGSVLVVPLCIDKDVIGAIKLYEPKDKLFLNMNKSLGEGITRLLSSQLLLSRYEQQKNMLVMSELKLIQAQVNPHFLFNTLNTIIAIIRNDANRARELLIDLSNFFRKNLKRSGDLSTLEEELEHVNSYLRIEKARFESRLMVEMVIDPALLKMRIPTFTLQPLIENAIKHGISQMLSQGVVKVSAYRKDSFAIIEIEDNAGTFDEEKQAKDGLGIRLVDKRIKNLLGDDFGTTVYCVEDEMTRVTIRMPMQEHWV